MSLLDPCGFAKSSPIEQDIDDAENNADDSVGWKIDHVWKTCNTRRECAKEGK
jgi:hypothetical protein